MYLSHWCYMYLHSNVVTDSLWVLYSAFVYYTYRCKVWNLLIWMASYLWKISIMLVNVFGWVSKRNAPMMVEGKVEVSCYCVKVVCKHGLVPVVCRLMTGRGSVEPYPLWQFLGWHCSGIVGSLGICLSVTAARLGQVRMKCARASGPCLQRGQFCSLCGWSDISNKWWENWQLLTDTSRRL